MKKLLKIFLALTCAAVMTVPMFATACEDTSGKNQGNNGQNNQEIEHVDYAGQLKLDFSSNTKKQEVTIRQYVDGDTTHFTPVSNSKIEGCNNAADFSAEDMPTKGYAKARYLAINTPESTAQIEEWGKAASAFTKAKLMEAEKSGGSIIIESNDENWNIDSTGSRLLLWVWYKTPDADDYRNLNIEILQAGLAYASGIPDTRYAEVAQAAIDQAAAEKLYVFSGKQDPDYWYGGPVNTTLKDLRFNPDEYVGKKIVVRGLVVANFDSTAYIEDTYYDIEGYEEEGIRIGMPVYYGYTKGEVVSEILVPGNYVSVVGSFESHATYGYQITNIKAYDRYKPVENCEIIEKVGLDGAFTQINPADFVSIQEDINVEIEKKDEEGKEYLETVSKAYNETIMGTSVTVSNLTVTGSTWTKNDESSNYGAFTLTCAAEDGSIITVRTGVFKDENGKLLAETNPNYFVGKKITVKGVVEYYESYYSPIPYQIKCHRMDYITIVG